MIDFERFTVIDFLSEVYSFSMLQDFVQIHLHLKANGITRDELSEYIKIRSDLIAQDYDRKAKAALNAAIDMSERVPKCSECGSQMSFQELNKTPCTVVPRYRSMYYCSNDDCLSDTRFSRKPLIELLKFLKIINYRTTRSDRKEKSSVGSVPSMAKDRYRIPRTGNCSSCR
jgi:hypothetical protein